MMCIADGQFSVPISVVSYASPTITELRGCQAINGSVEDCVRSGGELLTLMYVYLSVCGVLVYVPLWKLVVD
jgi:hypothetical protein